MVGGRLAALVVAGAGAAVAGAPAALAEPAKSFALTVSPARVAIPSGRRSHVQVFDLWNGGHRPVHVDLTLSEFEATAGRIVFTGGGPLTATAWLSVPRHAFDLPAGAHRHVRVTIRVPRDAEPGERQVALVFRVPPDESRPGFAVSGAVAAQLLISVPGRVVRKVAFGALKGPWASAGGPIRLRLTVRNLGNVHADFTGSRRLVVMAGSREVGRFPAFTSLRRSTRVVEGEWSAPPLVCLCRVEVVGSVGHGRRLVAGARIVVFPFRTAAAVLLIAVGATALLWLLRSRREAVRARELERVRAIAYWQAAEDARAARRRRPS
jgi:hypothetical protein